MRPPYLPRPDRAELLGLELHEIVRDYPETLGVLRRHGVDLREEGTRRLEAAGDPPPAAPASGASLVDDLLEALAWRRPR